MTLQGRGAGGLQEPCTYPEHQLALLKALFIALNLIQLPDDFVQIGPDMFALAMVMHLHSQQGLDVIGVAAAPYPQHTTLMAILNIRGTHSIAANKLSPDPWPNTALG